ncbi:MAG: ABC transporter ATP-binding protein, partial [Chloroflexi bacterium]|nr:ABC transporter ATP-binding protein [Chloroflexota bacterium]
PHPPLCGSTGIGRPPAGRATVLGFDVATQGDAVRRHTGVLTENPNLYESLTARENLRFFGEVYGYPEARLAARIEAVLEEMGLRDRADEPVGAYSKGMKQRLAIGKAILHEPPILFLDEPTAGLDPAAARAVTAMIEKLGHQEGRTIFLCTHNLVEAQRLCDRVGVINRGVLQAVGTPADLARRLWSSLQVEIDLRGEPSEAVRMALLAQRGVRNLAIANGRLRLELEDEECIPDVVRAVVSAGGRIYRVTPEE